MLDECRIAFRRLFDSNVWALTRINCATGAVEQSQEFPEIPLGRQNIVEFRPKLTLAMG
jgi:hypothetical protein